MEHKLSPRFNKETEFIAIKFAGEFNRTIMVLLYPYVSYTITSQEYNYSIDRFIENKIKSYIKHVYIPEDENFDEDCLYTRYTLEDLRRISNHFIYGPKLNMYGFESKKIKIKFEYENDNITYKKCEL